MEECDTRTTLRPSVAVAERLKTDPQVVTNNLVDLPSGLELRALFILVGLLPRGH